MAPPTLCFRHHILTAAFLVLVTAACVRDRDTDGHVRSWSFSSATDTVVLGSREDHVVAELTDLLEWRGDLVIVDAKENNIKAYNTSNGELARVLGRRGTGPGEFVSLVGAAVTPDGELAVLDALLHRVTFFRGNGDVRTSWFVPGTFGTGIDALANGDLIMAGRLVDDRRVISDSAVHRFTLDGDRVRAYLVLPEAVHFPEGTMNSMKAIVVDSTIVGLQHTTNVAVLHDLSDGVERTDSLGAGFYRPLSWTLEPPSPPDAVIRDWLRDQIMAAWLRDLDEKVYVAGFQIWRDSLDDWRTRWVFATPDTGPFAESDLTDAHPAFIRGGRLHSVRIRPDGRTELIIGEAPPPPGSE